ncbi:MFS_1_like domain-containing protein [Caerostris darwini]|uniref:MFS_1_like domain-containing protein n=1 Tax=Caerostris darwini TaxID=1538125 RepID=A0AAV4QXF5_9ARAC|nr:MFS_1_like domain-containing protein [Caerostris darwini]
MTQKKRTYYKILKEMEMLQVNKELLPIKVHYFLYNGALSGVIAFISVYAKQLGITADVMGIIFAVVSSSTVISRPLLGGLVDHFQKLKLVLVSLVLINIVADLSMNFIPQPTPSPTNSTNSNYTQICHQDASYLIHYQPDTCKRVNFSLCDSSCIVSCHHCQSENSTCTELSNLDQVEYPSECLEHTLSKCVDVTLEWCNRHMNESDDPGPENPLLQLCMMSLLTVVMYICMGSLASLSDAACFSTLGGSPELYGKQRMWGTMGWGVFAFLAGYLNQLATGSSSKYNYSAGFYMSVVLFSIDLIMISKLKVENAKVSKNIFKDVGRLLLRPRIILFLLQVLSVGLFRGMSSYYVFWYLRTLDASQLVLGCTSAVLCFLGELPFFFFSGWIITKIGHMNTFIVSFASYGAKFLSYSFIRNPWWSLLIEVLQGPCYGSLYAAMTSYAKIIAPEGTEATVQGIASGTLEGLGVATGCLLGGYGFQNLGGRETFFWTGIAAFVLGMVNCVINGVLVCRSETSEKDQDAKSP